MLKYPSYGLLTDEFKARGIKTTSGYDGLNRIKRIEFSDDTPMIKYYYDDTRGDPVNKVNKGADVIQKYNYNYGQIDLNTGAMIADSTGND